jgi:hypothetical protein
MKLFAVRTWATLDLLPLVTIAEVEGDLTEMDMVDFVIVNLRQHS